MVTKKYTVHHINTVNYVDVSYCCKKIVSRKQTWTKKNVRD